MSAATTARAYQMIRPTAAELPVLAQLFADFAADYCYEEEEGEALTLEADGVTITRMWSGVADRDWRFIKCSCGCININCASLDSPACFDCNKEMEITNRRRERADALALAA